MSTHGRIGVAGSLVLAVALAGCGARRPEAGPDELRAQWAAAARAANAEYEETIRIMLERMEREIRRAKQPTFDVLVAHGGGPAGAFAAGFLRGWGEVADPGRARPEFDLVTGSSSGALAAPYAFVGTPDAYDRLVKLYYDLPISIFRPGPFALWPWRSGLLDNAGLAELIRTEMDPALVEAIAAGAAEQRSMLIMTTDLDLGIGRVWDLTTEAQRAHSGAGNERLHDILLASASLPPVFPPVEIDGAMHTDGGVVASMFVGFGTQGLLQVAEAWSDRHPDTPLPRLRIWAIVNQRLDTPPITVQPRYLDVGLRSIDLMMMADRLKALLYLAGMVDRLDARENIEAEFHWVAIPANAKMPDLADLRDLRNIRGLLEVGEKLGADSTIWQRGEPSLVEWLPEDLGDAGN